MLGGGILASLASWLFSKGTKEFVADVVGKLMKTDDGQVKLAEIRATADVALAKEETAQKLGHWSALNQRQSAKINQPVFWIIIAVMLGPPALILWSVGIYNILFWEHGLWPQSWAIADFPPSIKPWVEKSIDWLYDPLGAPGTVGAAAVASWLTGRR